MKKTLGNKANSLQKMDGHNLPVPKFFVLDKHLFEEIFHKNKIISNDFNTIKKQIMSIYFDEQTKESINRNIEPFKDQKLIVRSSYSNEDSEDASFAGIFMSIKNVSKSDLYDAIKKVWASLFSNTSLMYHKKKGVSLDKKGMSIIIQEMVPTKYLYTIFSKYKSPQIMLIEKQDEFFETKKYFLDRNNIHDLLPDTPFHRKLITMVNKIESIFESPQNIELVVDHKHQIFVVQSRPITLKIRKNLIIYDKLNYDEVKEFYQYKDQIIKIVERIFNITIEAEDYCICGDIFLYSQDLVDKIKSAIDKIPKQKLGIITKYARDLFVKSIKRYMKEPSLTNELKKINKCLLLKEISNHILCGILSYLISKFVSKYDLNMEEFYEYFSPKDILFEKMCDDVDAYFTNNLKLDVFNINQTKISKEHWKQLTNNTKLKYQKKHPEKRGFSEDLALIENIYLHNSCIDYNNLIFHQFIKKKGYIQKKKTKRKSIYQKRSNSPIYLNCEHMIRGITKRISHAKEIHNLDQDRILLVKDLLPQYIGAILSCKAILVERKSFLSHAAIIAQEFKIPCVMGVDIDKYSDNQMIKIENSTILVEKE
ncbi:hypothetical protein K9M79_04930 [Candidatus Woesearchaeota archaeon]|nr:hypothetical protein [Candidatus Woesearchaeota archaeon]